MVEIYSASNGAEAYLVKALLEQNDIPAVVQGDMLGAAAGGIPVGPSIAPTVSVAEADAQRARALVVEHFGPK